MNERDDLIGARFQPCQSHAEVLVCAPSSDSGQRLMDRRAFVGRLARDFVTEPHGTEGSLERAAASVAAELVRLQVDVIVAGGSAENALKRATSTIPIVLPQHPDPVGQGLAQSLAHPGGNFRGISTQTVEIAGKRLELLKELGRCAPRCCGQIPHPPTTGESRN